MQLDLYSTDMVQKLARRDERTFKGLYDQYAGALYGIICRQIEDRHVADDLLRQTFILAWQDIEQYEPQKSSILIWLIRKCCSVTQQYTGAAIDLTQNKLVAKTS
jgi:DNA-directed RNA polymerase specialized sigma24 family protein